MGVGMSSHIPIVKADRQHHGESWDPATSNLPRSSRRGENPFEEVLDLQTIKSRSAKLFRKLPMKLDLALISLTVRFFFTR